MMSSRHIRATEIKLESPPSAGWLRSLGLNTAVTHEQSSPTNTSTVCQSQIDAGVFMPVHEGRPLLKLRVLPDTPAPFQNPLERQ